MSDKQEKRVFTDAFVSGKKEVVVDYNGEKISFFANALGFLASQNIAVQAGSDGKNALALLVAESITDADGNKFTYDEVVRLKKDFAEPLFNAVAEVNGIGEKEKN